VIAIRAILIATLLLAVNIQSQASTDAEVKYLLEYVGSPGCAFERNGTEHDSVGAADHLRLKYSRGKRYVNSAEQFIDRLASESSWTGKKYTVTCGDTTEPSGEWLHRALDQHRENS
jgi:hypothetical protein